MTIDTPYFRGLLALATAAVLSACARKPDAERPADSTPAAGNTTASASRDTAAMPSMAEMHGMGGGSTMEKMQAHMRMMDGAGADSMKAMLPMHRQMVANMISQFDRDMRSMNMKSDAAWQATIDSVRQDNLRLPEMSAADLRSFMPAHGARVMRLMDMHRAMMGNMK